MLPLLASLAVLQGAAASGWIYLHSGSEPQARPSLRTGHVTALGAAAVPGASAPTTTAPPTPPPPPTPAAIRLQSDLTAALAGTTGCAVAADGATRAGDVEGATPFAPASTQKLLVAAAALAVLGPDYRFQTTAVAPGPPSNGAVSQLWLVGSGDPVLATADYATTWTKDRRYAGQPTTPFESLADQLAAAGVRAVPGGIHGDDSRFSAVRLLPQWTPADVAAGNASPLSALDLNQGWQGYANRYLPAADPPAFAAGQLSRLLALRGVAAPPVPAPDAVAPTGAVLATVQSPPLGQIVSAMLRASDNHTAEMLTLALGKQLEGDGSTAAGLRAVTQVDQGLGIPTAGTSLVDGSGLSHDNRTTCDALLAAIDKGTTNPRLNAMAQGLPVAGLSGTLVNRWAGTPLQGHLSAKTGSIDGVAAMAGVLDLGHPIHFALILNGPGNLADVEQRIVTALAAYPGS
ncbi:MAG TPA: D-alanyl-D-alanine carboxypeptidase/D-alanyl-D-alanine-endopeptidase [Acidimicrobiales bacterium]|jgi:D-alanyl-D-alanine carboxypeptidase/D-alanyl-D-alanine-endopeptidase (penicillin-binding protein 4)